MSNKVAIISGNTADSTIMLEAIKILNDYQIEHESHLISADQLKEQLPVFAKELYNKGIRVIIAGTRGNPDYSNIVAEHFQIPVVGVPCRSETTANTVASVFSVLQQPNEHAVANVALDAGQNAGILTVQILALSDTSLQEKVITFKENLKNKILNADKELAQIKFEYRTN